MQCEWMGMEPRQLRLGLLSARDCVARAPSQERWARALDSTGVMLGPMRRQCGIAELQQKGVESAEGASTVDSSIPRRVWRAGIVVPMATAGRRVQGFESILVPHAKSRPPHAVR